MLVCEAGFPPSKQMFIVEKKNKEWLHTLAANETELYAAGILIFCCFSRCSLVK